MRLLVGTKAVQRVAFTTLVACSALACSSGESDRTLASMAGDSPIRAAFRCDASSLSLQRSYRVRPQYFSSEWKDPTQRTVEGDDGTTTTFYQFAVDVTHPELYWVDPVELERLTEELTPIAALDRVRLVNIPPYEFSSTRMV